MISSDHRSLFIHIPKTAGQSVESAFLSDLGLAWEQRSKLLLKPNNDQKLGPPRLAHLTASEYIDLGYIDETRFNSYFKFCFVRNPWSRLASEYLYRKGHGDAAYQGTLDDFIFKFFPKPVDDNHHTNKDYYRHVIPQVDFIYQGDKLCVDFVGRFERLDEDFSFIANKLNLQSKLLPHKNATDRKWLRLLKSLVLRKKDYRTLYTDRSAEWVAKYYASDIKKFNYCFEELN
ncbi:sulfotransferase family 2 domain-containing protein [Catenovulum sp. SM1970]|uniref:sulfotransferase family 2 domain-containing protein n=1 Tax=Marinifaba aquimaris TaxID=2741323 RepID=UPI00157405FF|nr:sulfotransferase family 2 domain-containing protein [Marinifaba aquimaris]NTS76907.1 sulfotransferase family 2 domain-containing protein [Marinifaba aquimaris]